MAVVNPQTFFRFAADHHELLVELYQHRDGITEAELLQVIRRFAGEGSPSASYVVDRLRELGFIDYAPHATAQYEMTRPFAELMSSLLREYRLTSVEVIRGYFTAMDSMGAEIGQAIAGKNGDLMVRALNDTAEHVERMRHDSRRNRDEVIATALRVKSNKDRMPPMRRYEIINRLWTRYLVPLRDMIDTQKAMDASLDRMERVLEEAEGGFQKEVRGRIWTLDKALCEWRGGWWRGMARECECPKSIYDPNRPRRQPSWSPPSRMPERATPSSWPKGLSKSMPPSN
jgi:hypothetical protein